MSLWSDIENAGMKVENFLQSISNGAQRLQKIYSALSGPVLAAVAAVFYDVVKAVAAGQAAAAAAGTGNVPLAITLSETTIGLVQKVVTDGKAGEKTIAADLSALGITL